MSFSLPGPSPSLIFLKDIIGAQLICNRVLSFACIAQWIGYPYTSVLSHFSRVWLFAALWTVARQLPLSLGFSRQEYWDGLPFLPPGDLPNPGIQPASLQFSSVAQSCLTLCDPQECSTPGLPVHHQLPEFTQTHVHPGGDAIQASHPLSSPSPPALNLSQHQGLFQWVSSSHQMAEVLEFQLQHQSFQWTPRTNFL